MQGHDCRVPVYDNDQNLEWLLAQRRDGKENK